jgi:hypothetical protein
MFFNSKDKVEINFIKNLYVSHILLLLLLFFFFF